MSASSSPAGPLQQPEAGGIVVQCSTPVRPPGSEPPSAARVFVGAPPAGLLPETEPSAILPDLEPSVLLPDCGPSVILPDCGPSAILPNCGPSAILTDCGPSAILPDCGPSAILPDGPSAILPDLILPSGSTQPSAILNDFTPPAASPQFAGSSAIFRPNSVGPSAAHTPDSGYSTAHTPDSGFSTANLPDMGYSTTYLPNCAGTPATPRSYFAAPAPCTPQLHLPSPGITISHLLGRPTPTIPRSASTMRRFPRQLDFNRPSPGLHLPSVESFSSHQPIPAQSFASHSTPYVPGYTFFQPKRGLSPYSAPNSYSPNPGPFAPHYPNPSPSYLPGSTLPYRPAGPPPSADRLPSFERVLRELERSEYL